MTGGSFKYLVKQGLSNLWLNRLMTFASIGILTACLILIGGAGLVALNVRDIFHHVEGQNEMRVFLYDEVTEEEMQSIENRLSAMPDVAEYTFISKANALGELEEILGSDAGIIEGYIDDNPLAASFVVTLSDISKTAAIQQELAVLPGVEQVNAMTEVVDTLTGLEKALLIFGGVIVIILVLASVVVIQNSIRLTVFARRREINIMKYVGATNGFIRLPFVVEGMSVGIVAAVLGFGIVYAIYAGILGIFETSSIGWVSSLTGQLIPFGDIWWWLAIGFLVFGVLLGSIGSSSAIRKYLKV